MGYSTTLVNLQTHRVFDILAGKSKALIHTPLMAIPGRLNVEMVCMDLCAHYRSLARELFPNAKIVADRFHVIRLVNLAFMKTWMQIAPELRNSRFSTLRLLRKRSSLLTASHLSRLNDLFDRYPAIKTTYDTQCRLLDLLRHKSVTQATAKRLIPHFLAFVQHLKNVHFEHLVSLGNTLFNWRNEIACMWRFSKSNGITEGLHRKMKLIQRRAYGMSNFYNYRLRVRALCGSIDFTLS